MSSADLKKILVDVEGGLNAAGVQMVSCPIVQPSEPFLDMAGEDLRRRIYLTQNAGGEALCLRPEFTIPVCLAHIEEQQQSPKRYGYLGEVFRQRSSGKTEFFQAGIEDLGNTNIAQADVTALTDALTLTRQCAANKNQKLTLGDQAVFAAVLQALGLPEGWQERLLHAFGNSQSVAALLERISLPEQPTTDPDELIIALVKDQEGLTNYLAKKMEAIGYSARNGRRPEDIAKRILERRELAEFSLNSESLEALQGFLDIATPLSEAVNTLTTFAHDNDIDLGEALVRFEERVNALQTADIDIGAMTYRAAFGRPLDYYTGLVFEITAGDDDIVLAAGGRYDRLMELLGSKSPVPAVGFSLWLDRFEVAS